ncbi:formate C-acetyltransferase [uncultured Cohaesibacter sp.]|uniref:formate C-acetyltransferase n=1 Tax=uncultured Cohaesibacter sp. TaxID=1002546 RepID=UPI00292DEA67|nr:formate C-acetyltransferase [uncultured Cohaesibacter sp.]
MSADRIARLKVALFAKPRPISLERARLFTESHRQSDGHPVMIRRALAVAHILDNVEISIREDELIAGNRTVKPRSGILSPEMDPYWFAKEIDTIHSRPQDKFIISDEDKQYFQEELLPYWTGRSMKDFINRQFPREVHDGVDAKIFSINQTDKGQGHIIADFPALLSKGLGQLLAEAKAKQQENPDNLFFRSVVILLEASQRHIIRYRDLAKELATSEQNDQRRTELEHIASLSDRAIADAPSDFREAVQLFWFMNVILQYESNASSLSLGRFDQYMWPFYKASLDKGEDPQALAELLGSLWIKTNDVVLLRSESSARFFAGFPTGYTILLGGLSEDGRSAETPLSTLCLDTYQDIQLPQPNLGVRVNELISRELLLKTAQTIRIGTGIPQIFNDEVIVPAFLNRGVSLEDARDYSVVGCVELSIPGKTYGLHDIAMFNLLKVMEIVLIDLKDEENVTFEQVIAAIEDKIRINIGHMIEGSNICDVGHRDFAPVPLLSSLIADCMEAGKDITYGGARYNFSGVQGIGIANLSDSLYALKEFVFEEKRMPFKAFVEMLEADYDVPEGEKIRTWLISNCRKYGNDDDRVDMMGSRLLRLYCKEVEKGRNPRGGIFSPGSYTVSAHVPLGAGVGATPDGRKAGEQLADGGLSPMGGRDQLGPTAVLQSVSKLDNYLLSNGSLLNVKFLPSTLEGQSGLNKLADFLMAFAKLKIEHIQFNVIDVATLRKAQEHPEDFAGLVVRVAGYSAFFIELSKEIQDDIIRRTEHRL